jgi:hypothetical protein
MAVVSRIKSRFLRALIECVEQEAPGKALARLGRALPPHLLQALSRDVLPNAQRDATVDLALGLELLLAIDRVLCGGSGLVTAQANCALASRVLSQSSGLVVPGDVARTLQHLRAPFEHPFVGVELGFTVRRSPDGFVLELELRGQARAASWLRAAGLGYAIAAARFSGNDFSSVRLDSEVAGDGARVFARRSESTAPPALDPPTGLRTTLPRRRSPSTNAVARVKEILGRKSSISGVRRVAPAPPARTRKSAS